MKKQRKTITLTMNGTFPPKGSITMERKITAKTMAKITMVIAEDEEAEAAEKKLQRELKKQSKIAAMVN